jgi:hypothetical protein
LTTGEVVAIDGKTLRDARALGGKPIVHMVSVWANANNLVLGQRKVEAKFNEITVIPKTACCAGVERYGGDHRHHGLSASHRRADCLGRADYILAVKENQPSLLVDVKDSFKMLVADTVAEESDYGCERVERWSCSVLRDLSLLDKPRE